MTKKQFLVSNRLTMKDRHKTNFICFLESKLRRNLIGQNDINVRTYMIAIRIFWPVISELPISLKLHKNASAFLESRGWYTHFSEDHSDIVSKYITRKC